LSYVPWRPDHDWSSQFDRTGPNVEQTTE